MPRQEARELTRKFIDHAEDGKWPDKLATGLTLQVTNGGRGKSWLYEFTSPVKFTVRKGRRKYKRRIKGLGSVKAAKGGLSLVEAREKAVLLTKQVRDGIDPIEAAAEAELARGAEAGEALTVGDAMRSHYETVIQYKPFSYRCKTQIFRDRIEKGLGKILITTLERHPELIPDRLQMLKPVDKWHLHRGQEEQLLFHLRSAIESVRGRCKIARNPASKDCLKHHGLTLQRTKPKGRYKAAAFKDTPRLMQRIEGCVAVQGTHYPAGARTTMSYLLDFCLRTGVRLKEARRMKYKELDEAKGVWLAPVENLKQVPGGAEQRPIWISEKSQAIINAVKPRRLTQSDDAYVFPSPLTKGNGKSGEPYHGGTASKTLNALWSEYRINPYGARTSLWMWADFHGHSMNLIDRQEGRRPKGVGATHYSSLGRAYLEDQTYERRRDLMKLWECYLDSPENRS
jgi:integrase